MLENIAVKVENLTKIFNLYDSPLDRLKESINPFGRKYHHEFYALNDVSFEVKAGETFGIVGRNGSGKSTLLKMISGVLTPSRGTVEVRGKVSAILELGAGFNPELTGIENIYFNGALIGHTREEMDSLLDDIIAFVDIGEFIHQPVKSYSSGMLVRLAFAVSINIDPDILIVDEALSVGDLGFQRKCFAKIDDLRMRNKTIIFVSHALDTMNLFCSRVILINNGCILKEGNPKIVTRMFQRMMLSDAFARRITLKNNIKLSDHELVDTFCENAGENVANISYNDQDNLSSKKIEIIEYGIINMEGDYATILESGNEYVIYSKVKANSDVSDVVVGFPIKDVKGLLLFSVNNRVQQQSISSMKGGDVIQIEVEITMWLAPGVYFLSFRAGYGVDLCEEHSDVIQFSVIGDPVMVQGSLVNLNPRLTVISPLT